MTDQDGKAQQSKVTLSSTDLKKRSELKATLTGKGIGEYISEVLEKDLVDLPELLKAEARRIETETKKKSGK